MTNMNAGLNFSEEIVLDFNSVPYDDTEGAEQRDMELCELLYSDDWLELDEDIIDIIGDTNVHS